MKFVAFLPAALLATLPLCAAGTFDFQLRDTQGASHTPAEWSSAKAVVVYFTTTDCPIANSYVPEMNRIHDAYAPRGIAFFAVQTDLTIPEGDVVKYARDFRYAYPLLLDPQQILIRHAGAHHHAAGGDIHLRRKAPVSGPHRRPHSRFRQAAPQAHYI